MTWQVFEKRGDGQSDRHRGVAVTCQVFEKRGDSQSDRHREVAVTCQVFEKRGDSQSDRHRGVAVTCQRKEAVVQLRRRGAGSVCMISGGYQRARGVCMHALHHGYTPPLSTATAICYIVMPASPQRLLWPRGTGFVFVRRRS